MRGGIAQQTYAPTPILFENIGGIGILGPQRNSPARCRGHVVSQIILNIAKFSSRMFLLIVALPAARALLEACTPYSKKEKHS
jgi:hypothetical protein